MTQTREEINAHRLKVMLDIAESMSSLNDIVEELVADKLEPIVTDIEQLRDQVKSIKDALYENEYTTNEEPPF